MKSIYVAMENSRLVLELPNHEATALFNLLLSTASSYTSGLSAPNEHCHREVEEQKPLYKVALNSHAPSNIDETPIKEEMAKDSNPTVAEEHIPHTEQFLFLVVCPDCGKKSWITYRDADPFECRGCKKVVESFPKLYDRSYQCHSCGARTTFKTNSPTVSSARCKCGTEIKIKF